MECPGKKAGKKRKQEIEKNVRAYYASKQYTYFWCSSTLCSGGVCRITRYGSWVVSERRINKDLNGGETQKHGDEDERTSKKKENVWVIKTVQKNRA